MPGIIDKKILFAKNQFMIDRPTCIAGTTQTGKSVYALNQFLNVPPTDFAIFIDFKMDINIKTHLSHIVVEGINQFKELKEMPNKMIFRSKNSEEIVLLIDFLHDTWAKNSMKKNLYLFFDEIHNYDDDEIIRVFTQGFGNNVIGIAISQRPQKIDQNILDNCDNYIFFRITVNARKKLQKNNDITMSDDVFNTLNSDDNKFQKFLFDQNNFRKL